MSSNDFEMSSRNIEKGKNLAKHFSLIDISHIMFTTGWFCVSWFFTPSAMVILGLENFEEILQIGN